MSDTTPTQYFGPHAKRWTSPATGEVLSLRPADYNTMVNKQMELDYLALQLEQERSQFGPAPLHIEELTIEEATQEKVERALAHEGWPNVISMDTIRERDLSAALEEGVRMHQDQVLGSGSLGSVSLSTDGIGIMSASSHSAASPQASPRARKRPAARHIRKRRISPRTAGRLGLLYIIAIIGVMAVAGVFS